MGLYLKLQALAGDETNQSVAILLIVMNVAVVMCAAFTMGKAASGMKESIEGLRDLVPSAIRAGKMILLSKYKTFCSKKKNKKNRQVVAVSAKPEKEEKAPAKPEKEEKAPAIAERLGLGKQGESEPKARGRSRDMVDDDDKPSLPPRKISQGIFFADVGGLLQAKISLISQSKSPCKQTGRYDGCT